MKIPNSKTFTFSSNQLRSNSALNKAVDLVRRGHSVFVDYDNLRTQAQEEYFNRYGLKEHKKLLEQPKTIAIKTTLNSLSVGSANQFPMMVYILENDILAGKVATTIDQSGFIIGNERL